jgi:hypothetical protein
MWKMGSKMKKFLLRFLPGTALGVLVLGGVAQAKNEMGYRAPRDCEFQLLSFGVDERLIYRNNHSGANLSTMFSWNPRYGLGQGWVAGASLGLAPMKAEEASFVAARYQVALSYWNLTCVYYPEITVGGESWLVKDGGSFATYGLNHYFRLTPKLTGVPMVDAVFDAMESWMIGYNYGETRDRVTRMYTLGIRFLLNH